MAAFGVLVHTFQRLRKLLSAVGSVAALGLIPLVAVSAPPQQSNVAPASGTYDLPASAAAIEQLRLSDSLAEFGERTGDAFALVAAAKIRKTLPTLLTATSPGTTSSRSWSSLLKRATQLSAGDQNLLGLIEDVRKLKSRDIPGIGEDVHLMHKMVKRKGTVRAEVLFKANEVAIVYVQPEGPGQIALYVYDQNNNLICGSKGDANQPMCRWRPLWDGNFLLDVRNDGSTDVAYRLAINREIVGH